MLRVVVYATAARGWRVGVCNGSHLEVSLVLPALRVASKFHLLEGLVCFCGGDRQERCVLVREGDFSISIGIVWGLALLVTGLVVNDGIELAEKVHGYGDGVLESVEW